jgi:hypothetical protein
MVGRTMASIKEDVVLNKELIQFNSIYLHANLTAKDQLQSEHVEKI